MKEPYENKAPTKKNANIKDFFAPFAKDRSGSTNRPTQSKSQNDTQKLRRSRSPTMGINSSDPSLPPYRSSSGVGSRSNRPVTPLVSESPALTSIHSEDMIETPSDLTVRSPSAPRVVPITSMSEPKSSNPTISSSQRVERHGQTYIRGSDDETASDSDLQELDDILKFTSKPAKTVAAAPPPLPDNQHSSRNSTRKRTVNQRRKLVRDADADFEEVMNMHKKDIVEEEAYRNALKLGKELEAETNKLNDDLQKTSTTTQLTSEAIVSRISDQDPENQEKVMQALQRMEAGQVEHCWSFFKLPTAKQEAKQLPPWPETRKSSLSNVLQNTLNRETAFLNGSMEDLALKDDLPQEIYCWILRYAYFEPREDLRGAYIMVAQSISHCSYGTVAMGLLKKALEELGGTAEALSKDQKLRPWPIQSKSKDTLEPNWQGLRTWLEIASQFFKWYGFSLLLSSC
jgi:hypothetical protein